MTIKPLTKAEWEVIRDGKWEGDEVSGRDLNACQRRVDATMDALFEYRTYTEGLTADIQYPGGISVFRRTDDVAKELGIE